MKRVLFALVLVLLAALPANAQRGISGFQVYNGGATPIFSRGGGYIKVNCSTGTTCTFNTGTGAVDLTSAGTGANAGLSNLASVAVNTALLPASDGGIDLDSSSFRYRDGWFSRNFVVGPLDASLNALTVTYTGKSFNRYAVLNSATASVQFGLTGAVQDNTTNSITGVVGYAAAEHTSGTKGAVTGLEGDAYCDGSGGTCSVVIGLGSYLQQSTGTTIGSMSGFSFFGQVNSGATAVTTGLYGFNMTGINLDANITVNEAAGSNIASITKSTGTINNVYGLKIANQTAGATNYAIQTGTGLVSFNGALLSGSAANLQLGAAAAAAPVAQTLSVQQPTATNTNQVSGSTTITGQNGTGTGLATCTFVFNAPSSNVATGTTVQTSTNNFCLHNVKALTTGAAATVASIALPTLAMAGGTIDYTIEATDGTSQCTESGVMQFAVENSAGVFVSLPSNATGAADAKACTATKTLTIVWAVTGANPSLVTLTPTLTGITATRFQVIYDVHAHGNAVITF